MTGSTILIGRDIEQKTFKELTEKDTSPFHLLLFVGPAGSGKSYLLHTLYLQCEGNREIYSFWLDLSPKVAEQNLATLIKRLALLSVSNQTDSVKAELAGWEDLPLFSGQPVSPIEPTTLSRRNSEFSTLAKYLNRVGHQRKTVLFIDTDTMTPSAVDNLSSFLLEHLNQGTLVVIGTRHRYALTRTVLGHLLTYIELKPFSLRETLAYLDACGLPETDLSEEVYRTTKGLPLLITELIPDILNRKLDIQRSIRRMHVTMLDRAFREIDDERMLELARTASVLRRFNLEVLEKLFGRRKIQTLFERLRECSFVETDGPWMVIDSVLRESVVYEWRSTSPNKFVELNKAALRYYESLSVAPESQLSDIIQLEIIYHHLCVNEEHGIEIAIDDFTRAEALFNVNFCRAIVKELRQFSFSHFDAALEWIGYCEATIARLDCHWSEAHDVFEKYLPRASSSKIRAYLLYGLSKTLWELGNWKEAQTKSRQASEAFGKVGDKKAEAISLIISGSLLAHQHIWDQSLRQFNNALAILGKGYDSLASFQLQLGLAELFRLQGIWDTSLEHLNAAMNRSEELRSKALQAQVSHNLGKLHRSRRAWDMAIHYFERSALLREEVTDQLGQAQSLHSLGNIHLRANHLDEASVILQKSLRIKQSLNDKFGIAKSYNGLGHIQRLKGDLEEALAYYQQSLSLFREVNNDVKTSRLMCRIGMTLVELNRINEAIEFLEESRASRQKANDPQGVAETLYELGNIHERSGEISTARDLFALSFKFAKNSRSLTRQLAPIVQLVVLAYRDEDAKTGTEYILTARRIAAQNKQHSLLSHLYEETAKAEASSSRLTTTLLCYAEAIHASLLEDYKTTAILLSEIVRFLEQIEALQGQVVAEDFAHNLLVFLQKNSDMPQQETQIWSQIIPSGVVFVPHGEDTTLMHLKNAEQSIASII